MEWMEFKQNNNKSITQEKFNQKKIKYWKKGLQMGDDHCSFELAMHYDEDNLPEYEKYCVEYGNRGYSIGFQFISSYYYHLSYGFIIDDEKGEKYLQLALKYAIMGASLKNNCCKIMFQKINEYLTTI